MDHKIKEQRKLICRQYRDCVLGWEEAMRQLKKTGLGEIKASDHLLLAVVEGEDL